MQGSTQGTAKPGRNCTDIRKAEERTADTPLVSLGEETGLWWSPLGSPAHIPEVQEQKTSSCKIRKSPCYLPVTFSRAQATWGEPPSSKELVPLALRVVPLGGGSALCAPPPGRPPSLCGCTSSPASVSLTLDKNERQ